MRILITGGAGYIGSHTVRAAVRAGHEVTVVDNLVQGRREAVASEAKFFEHDVGDHDALLALLRGRSIEAVVHFAARIQVGESVAHPRRYYRDNIVASLTLLDAVRDAGVGVFVFSSSAAVYGAPERVPIDEAHPLRPLSPYGETKLVIERALAAYGTAYGLRHASMRYFNAAGADAAAGLGERHEPETHLVPLALRAASGMGPALALYGADYPTRDGTCERDYIHVADLADAHLAALAHLAAGGEGGAFNLGTGRGYTVREVLDATARTTGHEVPVRLGPRRPGDPAALVASAARALRVLRWEPTRSSLERILEDAWAWERRPARSLVQRPMADGTTINKG